jgi:hypothetical protein
MVNGCTSPMSPVSIPVTQDDVVRRTCIVFFTMVSPSSGNTPLFYETPHFVITQPHDSGPDRITSGTAPAPPCYTYMCPKIYVHAAFRGAISCQGCHLSRRGVTPAATCTTDDRL